MADDKAIDWGGLDVGASAGSPARDTIVVHCVNGHRLVVPATLAGKWGKCAKCQAAFQIPAAGDAKAGVAAPPGPQRGDPHAVHQAAEAPAARSADAAAAVHLVSGVPAATPAAEPASAPVRLGPGPGTETVASLVNLLWAEVDRGAVVEVHVDGGSVVLPKWFERRLSAGTHGLFASQAVDGSITLTAVAWASVQKIVVRGVDGLPAGMFEQGGAAARP